MNYTSITVKELKDLLNSDSNTLLIDVRTEEEWQDKHFCNAKLLPLADISLEHIYDLCSNMEQQKQLDVTKPINLVFYCRAGVRSLKAIEKLFDSEHYNKEEVTYNFELYNLKGGITSCKVWL